jgi:parallel beta helix pectate lyase-like protein
VFHVKKGISRALLLAGSAVLIGGCTPGTHNAVQQLGSSSQSSTATHRTLIHHKTTRSTSPPAERRRPAAGVASSPTSAQAAATVAPPTQASAAPTTSPPPLAASSAPVPSAGCTRTLTPGAKLAEQIVAAAPRDVLCLADGDYGQATLAAAPSDFVTIRAVHPWGARFTRITIGGTAAHLRLEQLQVTRQLDSEQGNASSIELLGNKLFEVEISSGPKFASSGPGAHDWLVANNDITNGITLTSQDPTAPGSPRTVSIDDVWWPVSRVTLRANKIGPLQGGEDAIRIAGWRDLVIEDNEITGIVEDGQHNDCLQSVWGGDGLVFRGNYLHDNDCQGFFIKDGSARNVRIENNLFLRDTAGRGQTVVSQIWDSTDVTLQNNTVWDESAFLMRWENEGTTPARLSVTGNVLQNFDPQPTDRPWATALVEDRNVLGASPWSESGRSGTHSQLLPDGALPTRPAFVDPAHDDFRLSGSVTAGGVTYTAGVDWSPKQKRFGASAFSTSS